MDFQRVDEGKFLLNITEADNINHIVIFLTGTVPLPVGMAGAVYFSWPDANAPPNWQFLGKQKKNNNHRNQFAKPNNKRTYINVGILHSL